MSQHTELRLELTKNLKWNGLLGVWLIKHHELIGLIERAADALQAMERVPMTEEAIRRGWLELTELAPTPYAMYVNAVRTTESHHGITPPESKG